MIAKREEEVEEIHEVLSLHREQSSKSSTETLSDSLHPDIPPARSRKSHTASPFLTVTLFAVGGATLVPSGC